MSDFFIEVLVPVPLQEKFIYLLPSKKDQIIPSRGTRVLVPFGRRELVGVVWSTKTLDQPEREYRNIIKILDDEPLIDTSLLNLADWAARYYHYPLGEVISYFFPPSLRKGKEAKFLEKVYWHLTTKGEFFDLDELRSSPAQKKALDVFRKNSVLSQISAKAFGISLQTLNALNKKSIINKESKEVLPKKSYLDLDLKSFSTTFCKPFTSPLYKYSYT